MNRLQKHVDEQQQKDQKLFCAYATLGYPSVSFTKKLIVYFEKAGVDIFEMGIPFSDPMADGPTIQNASYKSLTKKTTVQDAFSVMKELRKKGLRMPVVFFSYYNLIFHYGIKKFVRDLALCGFDALLCPDLPPEEDVLLQKELTKRKLMLIRLVAPTTAPARIEKVVGKGKGFIYYVSHCGVTGTQRTVAKNIGARVRAIKKHTCTPVLVGFGVSTSKQVRAISRESDGVIVGSAIIKKIEETNNPVKTAAFVKTLVRACKRST